MVFFAVGVPQAPGNIGVRGEEQVHGAMRSMERPGAAHEGLVRPVWMERELGVPFLEGHPQHGVHSA